MLLELAIGIPLVISIKKYTLYNMHSVTSNAVAESCILNKDYYDANTNKDVLQNRINAMLQAIPQGVKSGITTIKYAGGHFFCYIYNYTLSEQTITEIIPYSGETNVFYRSSANVITLMATYKNCVNFPIRKYLPISANDINDFIVQLFNYCHTHTEENLISGDWVGNYFYSAYSQTIGSVYTMIFLFMSNSQAWLLWGANSLEGSKAL